MSLSADVDVKAFLASLDSLRAKTEQAIEDGLDEAHKAIMEDARDRCPVDTGALRASGEVFPPLTSGGESVSSGAFGGDAVTGQYAILQHEDTFRQPKAKWYQKALEAGASKVGPAVARELRKVWR